LICHVVNKCLFKRGSGWCGQLGHNNRDDQIIPKEVEALADELIVNVVCGGYHTCAVTSTGSIFTWGSGIAIGHVVEGFVVLQPKFLEDLSFKGVVCVSANENHTACVTKAGEVFSWGSGMCGKLGHGDERNQGTPKRVEALVGVNAKEICCGQFHTADMYQIEGLKYCCMGTLERGLSAENVSKILEEVEELSWPCDELKRVCHENL